MAKRSNREPQTCPLCSFLPVTFQEPPEVMCFTGDCGMSGKTFTMDEWAVLTKDNWQEESGRRAALRQKFADSLPRYFAKRQPKKKSADAGRSP